VRREGVRGGGEREGGERKGVCEGEDGGGWNLRRRDCIQRNQFVTSALQNNMHCCQYLSPCSVQ
jgi:hypothetical protein